VRLREGEAVEVEVKGKGGENKHSNPQVNFTVE
jgi:hypothetical protein